MSDVLGFERDPYLKELAVQVLQVVEDSDRWVALLDDTILYPEGGGQPSDRGWLNDVPVLRVEKSVDGPRHVLVSVVAPGTATLTLDWQRRYDHMQQHTAQHVLTRTALDRFGWRTRSFHIGPSVSDIELDCAPPGPEEIAALEDAVACHIAAARPIRSYRVSTAEMAELEVRSRGLPAEHRGDVRLVEIDGLDRNTCGGTHLASTAEIETLKVVGQEPLRGGCRLHWVAGRRVRTRLAEQGATMSELRSLLDTGDEALVAGLRVKLEQLREAKRDRRWLEKRLAEALFDVLEARSETLVDLHLEGPESAVLRPLAEQLAARGWQQVALLTAESGSQVLFAVVVGSQVAALDPQVAGQAVAEALGGRGGGAGQVFQGKAASLEHRALAVERLRALLP